MTENAIALQVVLTRSVCRLPHGRLDVRLISCKRDDWSGIVLGSVASGVPRAMRDAGPAHPLKEPSIMFERILVPVDGSDTSTKALLTALKMATDSGGRARLRLIHVFEEMAVLSGYDAVGVATSDLLMIMRENGAKLLGDAMAIAKAAGVEADCQLLETLGERLGETVAKAATDWKADIVVVGTHGRHGLGRVFLGSGAEQVIRLAPVPVLVVRSTAPAADAHLEK